MSKFNIGDAVIFARTSKVHDGTVVGILKNSVDMPPTYVVRYADECEIFEPLIRRFRGER